MSGCGVIDVSLGLSSSLCHATRSGLEDASHRSEGDWSHRGGGGGIAKNSGGEENARGQTRCVEDVVSHHREGWTGVFMLGWLWRKGRNIQLALGAISVNS